MMLFFFCLCVYLVLVFFFFVFFFKQKTAYDMRISDWSSDVCSSDLAIIEHLNDKTGNERFWPTEVAARGMARSMAAEMHSSFLALRREHSMNIRQIYAPQPPSAETMQDIERIMQLWAEARARFGGAGDFLFGEFGARAEEHT